MDKIIINPLYREYADFLHALPEIFRKEGTLIYKGRNEVKLFKIRDKELVVKSFKVPHFINRIVYAYFRSSKAARSYCNGMKLMNKHIGTPAPVAYMELRKNGLFHQSFYICEKSRFHREFRELCHYPGMDEADQILTDFAIFSANLHNKDVYHKDYTPGNILFGKVDDKYEFELIDINRMIFCPVDIKMGCKNFDRLCIQDDMYKFVARVYAKERNFDPSECEKLIIKYRDPDA